VVFRKKIYASLEELKVDLVDWLWRTTRSDRTKGSGVKDEPPLQTFLDGKVFVREKMLVYPAAQRGSV